MLSSLIRAVRSLVRPLLLLSLERGEESDVNFLSVVICTREGPRLWGFCGEEIGQSQGAITTSTGVKDLIHGLVIEGKLQVE